MAQMEHVATTSLNVNHGNPGAALIDLLNLVMKKKVERVKGMMSSLCQLVSTMSPSQVRPLHRCAYLHRRTRCELVK